jgi:hypothetical protein
MSFTFPATFPALPVRDPVIRTSYFPVMPTSMFQWTQGMAIHTSSTVPSTGFTDTNIRAFSELSRNPAAVRAMIMARFAPQPSFGPLRRISSDDAPSAKNNDPSSTEDDGADVSSVEDSYDGHSSTGSNSETISVNEIPTLRPNNERPNFSLDDFIKDSPVASMLPEFLAQMHAANQELEEEKAAGTLANRRIELDENDSALEDEQYIEMNLGLGVLEEKSDLTSTTSESDSGNESGDLDVMEKLLGGKRKRVLEGEDEGAPKKAKIQEV